MEGSGCLRLCSAGQESFLYSTSRMFSVMCQVGNTHHENAIHENAIPSDGAARAKDVDSPVISISVLFSENKKFP